VAPLLPLPTAALEGDHAQHLQSLAQAHVVCEDAAAHPRVLGLLVEHPQDALALEVLELGGDADGAESRSEGGHHAGTVAGAEDGGDLGGWRWGAAVVVWLCGGRHAIKRDISGLLAVDDECARFGRH
jgi:hypothetical protein